MAASILLACGLNQPQLPPFIFLEQESGADGSFLINCILSQRLKMIQTTKLKVVLACCHQTFEHYSTAGLRFGYNLQSFKENQRIKTIEPLTDMFEQLFLSNFLKGNSESLLTSFRNEIGQAVGEEADQEVLLIIDDLSFLCNLGVSEVELVRFIRHLSHLTERQGVRVILKLNTSDCYETVTNYTRDFAKLAIKIERLKSGKFREVDGKLSVLRLDDGKTLRTDDAVKTILYKVTEKAVKIFAPGEVGIKI